MMSDYDNRSVDKMTKRRFNKEFHFFYIFSEVRTEYLQVGLQLMAFYVID